MLKKPTLAIIEDNLDLQEELSFFLEAKGYNCWFAASAEEFWKKLHLQKADIFLIDIGLPGEDGFSLIKHLSKLGDFGLIIITARGGKQDYLQGLSLGADLYLVKPVNFSDLNDKLESLWQRMQVARQEASLETSENFAVDYRENDKRGWLLDKVDCCLVEPKGLLLQQSNQIISRDHINDTLFKHLENNDVHRVDVIVSRLRKKAKAREFYLPLRSIFGKGLAFIVNE